MWMLVIAVLVAGCAVQTETYQFGNDHIQLMQTQNLWNDNAVVYTDCPKLYNGFCPEGSPKQVVIMPGKLPGIVSSGVQAGAVLGGSAIIADGLRDSKTKVNMKNTNRNDVRASTVNPR
jgi:hypothetical protein